VELEGLSLLAASLLTWVALVHLVMALGVRRGELVWSGRYPRLLVPSLRRRSLGYAVLLVVSAWILAVYGGAVESSPIPDSWLRPAGWAVTALLSVAVVYAIFKGSRWERALFLPITLFGAILAGWLTFS
jgi:hypothetical protein